MNFIEKTIAFSIRNRFLVLLCTAILFAAGVHLLRRTPVDAIPDLSDVQVIVYTEYPGQSPRLVEDQVTYPLTTSLVSVPGSKTVRGYSFFGYSLVYILFEDGTDLYWARSRVLEYLNAAQRKLPAGAVPTLGPDATSVGWIYQYALTSTRHSLQELRSLQDWFLKYELASVEGVSEVASIGGFVKQYQVTVDPVRLRAFGVSVGEIEAALQRSNGDAGGEAIEMGEMEFMIRGLGGLKSLEDIRKIPIRPGKAFGGRAGFGSGAGADGSGGSAFGGTASGGGGEPMSMGGGGSSGGTGTPAGTGAGLSGAGGSRGSGGMGGMGGGTLGPAGMGGGSMGGMGSGGMGAGGMGAGGMSPAGMGAGALGMGGMRAPGMAGLSDGPGAGDGGASGSSLPTASAFSNPLPGGPRGGRVPLLLGDIANVTVGPEMRRGIADLDGEGEVAGGIVIMRSGENALQVIEGVKEKLESLKPGLPAGVEIVPVYDRASLIGRAVDNLKHRLVEEILIVAAVCLLFLFHLRSALVAVFTLPMAILAAFIVMRAQGLNADIMSLGGIAIAIGAMVDAAIIMVENLHKHMEEESEKPAPERRDHWRLVLDCSREVGPSLFFSLLVITVSFIPVFTLGEQEGRLFRPLAFTKTYAMAAAAALAITLVPVLMGLFIRGRIVPEHRNPLNRLLIRLYRPVAAAVLRHPKTTFLTAAIVTFLTIFPFLKLGSEFMPPLREGDILYMPTTLPGISVTKARQLLQQTDRIIKSFPEVERVFGKAGRAETATDPAGMDMLETTIMLKPEAQWREGMTLDKLIEEMDAAIRFPGLTNSWTMPIKTRLDMLSTGIKTPVGIKISGPDLDTLERLGREVEALARQVPGTSSAFAERTVGGNYLDIRIDRDAAARYGLLVEDIQGVIRTALAGMPVTYTVEGLERYSVNLRYARELRDDLSDIGRVLVPSPRGGQIPLGQVASITPSKGPMVIRSENSRPNSWVFVDLEESDLGGYVAKAKTFLAERLKLPPGYTLIWSGQYEYLERMNERLLFVIPLTLALIFIILYINTGSLVKTGMVLLAVPFSLVGAIWLLFLLDYQMSLAVWIGLIALAGLDAETGVVMLLYLDQAYDKARKNGALNTLADLREAIDHGAVRRVRPKIMTASVIVAGLLPILVSAGTGSDVMKRIAAPMVGGVFTSVLMELLVYPALYYLWRKRELRGPSSGF